MNRRHFAVTLSAALFMDRLRFVYPPTPPATILDVKHDHSLLEVPHWMEIACVPGAVVALIEKGTVTTVLSFGVRRSGESGSVDANTLFDAASLSKPVFASAVLQLVENKVLDLDRPLAQIVALTDDSRAKLITARHVLSHSSGLQNWREPGNDQFKFAFSPGEGFCYSGEGYFYLQRVLEKLTGQPFALFMQETVLKPLGMERSSYVWRQETNLAAPHSDRGTPIDTFNSQNAKRMAGIAQEWGKPLDTWTYEDMERAMRYMKLPVLANYMQPNAAWSLLSSATDYAKFLVHSFSLETMRTPQVKINSDLSWGLGVGLERDVGPEWYFHAGDDPGIKNFFVMDAKSRAGLLVFTNSDGGAKLYQRIVRTVIGKDLSAFLWT